MNLGKEVKFEDIPVGDVFAADGCIGVLEKRTKTTAMCLAITEHQTKSGYQDMQHLPGKILQIGVVDFTGELGLTEYNDSLPWFGEQYSPRKNGTGFYLLDKPTQRLWKTGEVK